MSFGEINTDAVRGSIEDASAGPRLGFQDAMVAAWDATTKAHSLLAVEQGMRAIEQAQIKKIQEAGLRAPNSLDDSEDVAPVLGADNSDRNPLATTFRQGRYSAAAQSIVDGGGWYTDEMVAQRDEQLKKLQAERPDLGIQTYTDMFKQVQKDAQDAEQRSQLPKTLGGHIGAFLGEAGGSLDPSSNPINFATGAVGGGEGVIGRAVVQGAVQATAEAGNLAVSDPENILLGRQRTPGEDLGRIAMAGVAGAGADLLLSGAGAALRRMRTGKWFNDVPLPDPPKPTIEPSTAQTFQGAVPPPMKPGLPLHEYPDWDTFARAHGEEPNVYGPSPEAKPRTAADLNYVATELNKWDGPAPWELRPPPTDTVLPGAAPQGVDISIAPGAYTRYLDNLETVHDIARRIDPETFKAYDTLQQQIADLRGSIEHEKGVQTFFDADETARRGRELSMRQQIQKYDQQMRDMAPLVSRAYGLAEKEWRTTPLDHNTIEFFKSIEESGAQWRYRGEDKPSLTEQPPRIQTKAEPVVSPKTVNDTVPLASMEPDIDKRLNVNNDTAAERVKQNVAHTQEKLDEAVQSFTDKTGKIAKIDDVDVAKTTKDLETRIAKLQAERSAAASSTGITEAFDTLKGGGVSEDFYRRAYEGYLEGKTQVAGISEPLLVRAKREGVVFSSVSDVRAYYEGKPRSGTKAANVEEALAKTEKELDELHYVTFPDGRKLHLDNDRAPFVHDDGRVEEMSVRDFLREMAKDQDALQSVITCQRPS